MRSALRTAARQGYEPNPDTTTGKTYAGSVEAATDPRRRRMTRLAPGDRFGTQRPKSALPSLSRLVEYCGYRPFGIGTAERGPEQLQCSDTKQPPAHARGVGWRLKVAGRGKSRRQVTSDRRRLGVHENPKFPNSPPTTSRASAAYSCFSSSVAESLLPERRWV